MDETTDHEMVYRVVISDEERYSIWPDYKEIPWGWRADAKSGSKQECLDYIKEVWTDMRPISLRQRMQEQSDTRAAQDGD
jgi:MbtH protein